MSTLDSIIELVNVLEGFGVGDMDEKVEEDSGVFHLVDCSLYWNDKLIGLGLLDITDRSLLPSQHSVHRYEASEGVKCFQLVKSHCCEGCESDHSDCRYCTGYSPYCTSLLIYATDEKWAIFSVELRPGDVYGDRAVLLGSGVLDGCLGALEWFAS